MKTFVNDSYDQDCPAEQAENNKKESGDGEDIDIKLKEEGMQQMKITKMLLNQIIHFYFKQYLI